MSADIPASPSDPRESSSPPLRVADLAAAERAIRRAEHRALFGDLYCGLRPYRLAAWDDVGLDRGRIVALSVCAA